MSVLVAPEEVDTAVPVPSRVTTVEHPSRALWLVLAIAIAVTFLDRGLTLLTNDLRFDENLTGWITADSFGEAISRSWDHQGQSPLYFMGLWMWEQVFGSSELSLRIPSLIAFALATWQLIAIGRDLGRVQAGQIGAALLVSINDSGFEARPYVFMLLALVVSARAGLLWAAGGSSKLGAIWAVSGALAMYFQPFAFFALLSSLVIAVAGFRKGRGKELVGWVFLGGLVLLPLVPQVLALRARQDTLVIVSMPDLGDLAEALLPLAIVLPLIFAILNALVNGEKSVQLSKHAPAVSVATQFLLLWMLLPAVGLFAQSHLTGSSVFVVRYYAASVPAFALGAGMLLSRVPQVRALIGIVIVVLLSAYSTAPYPSRNWDPAVEAINAVDSSVEVWNETGYIESNSAQYFDGEHNGYLSSPLLWHGADRELLAVPRLASPELIPIHQENLDRVIRGAIPVLLVEEYGPPARMEGLAYIDEALLAAGFEIAEQNSESLGVMTTLYIPPDSSS